MANKKRGETDIEFEGERLTLKLTTNSICDLEEATGLGVIKVMAKLQSGVEMQVRDIRIILWALMLDAKPDATLEEAGRAADAFKGGLKGVIAFVRDASLASFEDQSKDAAPGK